ncbi:MAG TPA: bifunctional hydroxymethylpyrimidine kinase/phosphomethylpyrimidine kinase [Blastocatellia bacterium]|jgi:hydroxymethylpyrimidine kinase/phosphomethylpyrimidine kinase|nr:bifunctional hydroxymethylpyrimidine kinase/phosphomethylpyrimidine kinase [Blastocatellia bacterium]
MAEERPKIILVIAGFDPSGGAGILADTKTIGAFGCYGAVAITSLTLQNTQGVFGAYNQTAEAVLGQLRPLFDDFDVSAVKTGMLPSLEVIRAVAETISSKAIPHVVVDPVVRSTSGFDLIDDVALRELIRSLFPLASVVTPNVAEVERITGIRIKGRDDMEKAGRSILDLGPPAVLVKGGDMTSDTATDLLVDSEGAIPFVSERVFSRNTHGTGCTLASALACLLARGKTLREAVPIAKRYLVDAIRTAPGLGKGHGPLNHFPPGFKVE